MCIPSSLCPERIDIHTKMIEGGGCWPTTQFHFRNAQKQLKTTWKQKQPQLLWHSIVNKMTEAIPGVAETRESLPVATHHNLTIHQAKYFPFILIMPQFQKWLDSCLLLVLYQYLDTGFALPNKAFIWGWVFSDLWLRVQGRWGHFKLVKYRTQHNLLMALVSGENCN